MNKKIAYILGGFPQDTPTFIYHEIEGLAKLGIDLRIVSLHPMGVNENHLDYKKWLPKTCYAGSLNFISMFYCHVHFAFTKPMQYINLFAHYRAFGGKRVCWVAPHVAYYIKKERVGHMHAHFAWSAADLARAVTKLTGIRYSMTAHQSDIHRLPERLEEKMCEAAKVFTCTKGNAEFLLKEYPESVTGKIEKIFHGVDLNQFSPLLNNKNRDIDIISVGNLIEVKGFIYLVQALIHLASRGLKPRCLIVGDGPEKKRLLKSIEKGGLQDNVTIIGKMPQAKLAALYSKSRMFVLPCVEINGAPHGIPNVLTEAMAMGLPVVSADVPHIPELIENGKDGILVSDKDPEALAGAIQMILTNREKRTAIGKSARKKIERKFNAHAHIQTIAEIFGRIDQYAD